MTPTAAAPGEPACAEPLERRPRRDATPKQGTGLRAELRSVGAIPPREWDALAASNSWSTPFARWGFQRAWWDAYSGSAHEQTLVVVDAGGPDRPVGIVPLMHRHQVEPTDAATQTRMRHGRPVELTPVGPDATTVFFGASYHADYATILAAPERLALVAEAAVDWLATTGADPAHPAPWDAVDLRRLRCGDPAADALAEAFGRREVALGWTLNVEREDVSPVVTLPEGADFDAYLATLRKKDRHEIRRKLRRAEAGGEVRLEDSADPLADLDAFIELHQRRWGAEGLFPETAGGTASRTFIRRLFELLGPDGTIRLAFLTIGGRRVAAGIHFETADGYLYYNAGTDPDARGLSPGVVMIARYVQRAIAAGKRRLDFLRGDESYKYEWGAVDEPIQRLLVRRTVS